MRAAASILTIFALGISASCAPRTTRGRVRPDVVYAEGEAPIVQPPAHRAQISVTGTARVRCALYDQPASGLRVELLDGAEPPNTFASGSTEEDGTFFVRSETAIPAGRSLLRVGEHIVALPSDTADRFTAEIIFPCATAGGTPAEKVVATVEVTRPDKQPQRTLPDANPFKPGRKLPPAGSNPADP